jgi:hypothetical protein
MRGRPRINADRPLTNRECVQRWREKHKKPPAPKPESPFVRLRTFSELAESLERPPRPFDVEALIG